MNLAVLLLRSAFLQYPCCTSASRMLEQAIPNLVVFCRSRFRSLPTFPVFVAFSFFRLSICFRDLLASYWSRECVLDHYDKVSHTFSFIRAIIRREVSVLAALVSFFSEHGRRPNRKSAISHETQGCCIAVLLPVFNTAFSDCTFGREFRCCFANSIVLAASFPDLYLL